MSLDYTPTGVWREIEYAEKQNRRRTAGYDALREGYHTPFFDGNDADIEGNPDGASTDHRHDPENHAYSFASFMVPQMVAGNPEFDLASRRTDPEDESHTEVKALGFALNQWVLDTDFRTTMDALALDPLFSFAVAMVTPKQNRATYHRSSAEEGWPEVQRISPRNFIRDPAALRLEECRYLGHRFVMDAGDLRALAEEDKKAGWDLELLKDLEGNSLSEEYRPVDSTRDAPQRGEIELYEVWFPARAFRDADERLDDESEVEDDEVEAPVSEKDGFHGTIYTMAVVRGGEDAAGPVGTHQWVRKPRAYYGHKSGPYAHCAMMRVPDDPWGLAPLVATQGQAADLNALTRAQNDDIRRYKNMVGVDCSSDPELASKIENNEHQTVMPLMGVGASGRAADLIHNFEVGGPSQMVQAAIELAHARLRRNSGMGEAQTGQAPGGGTTATAVAVASQDSDTRIERMKEQWRRFLEDIGIKVAHCIGTSKDVKITLDTKAARELSGDQGMIGAEYKGGALSPSDFDHMQITLDVVSVERTSEERVQARLMQAIGMVTQSIPMVMQLPSQAFWEPLFKLLGDALNVPGMGKMGSEMVNAALAVLQGDIPSLATQPDAEASPGVSVGGGAPRPSQQKPAPSTAPAPQQQQHNRTPGLSNGVSQPTPLAGVGGTNAR